LIDDFSLVNLFVSQIIKLGQRGCYNKQALVVLYQVSSGYYCDYFTLYYFTNAASLLVYIWNRASGQSLYQVLGLQKNCTQEDIKKAYRKVILLYNVVHYRSKRLQWIECSCD